MKYPPQKSFTYLEPIFSFYKQWLFEKKNWRTTPFINPHKSKHQALQISDLYTNLFNN